MQFPRKGSRLSAVLSLRSVIYSPTPPTLLKRIALVYNDSSIYLHFHKSSTSFSVYNARTGSKTDRNVKSRNNYRISPTPKRCELALYQARAWALPSMLIKNGGAKMIPARSQTNEWFVGTGHFIKCRISADISTFWACLCQVGTIYVLDSAHPINLKNRHRWRKLCMRMMNGNVCTRFLSWHQETLSLFNIHINKNVSLLTEEGGVK